MGAPYACPSSLLGGVLATLLWLCQWPPTTELLHARVAVMESFEWRPRLDPVSAVSKAPLRPPEPLPACLQQRVRALCLSAVSLPTQEGDALISEWQPSEQVLCMVNGTKRGRFKAGSLELENLWLQGCAVPPLIETPPAGTSSLRVTDVDAAVGIAPGTGQPMARLRQRLAAPSARVSIVAIGSSNTARFASVCADRAGGCELPANAAVEAVLASQAQKAHTSVGSDWLARFVRTLKRRRPSLDLSVRTVAYGGMSAWSVQTCPEDFLCTQRSANGGCTTWPDLAVLDFAIYMVAHSG